MDILLKHIKVCDLIEFCNSDSFKTLEFEPISRYRALSYSANPKANKEDTALLLAYDNEKLIGYLGMFTDRISYLQQDIKFCWFSCMWVLPEYRRSGIAFHLLKEGYKAFNGFVMITNFIPQSKAAFIKTGQYKELEVLNGYRFYLKSDLKNILMRKYQKAQYFNWLWLSIDKLSNQLISIAYSLKPNKKVSDYSFNFINNIDKETSIYINKYAEQSLFQRTATEFTWMKEFPWISDSKELSIDYSKYYFSQYCEDFCQWFVNIRNKQNKLVGFAVLTRHKGELKTPYFFLSEDLGINLGIFITDFAKKNKIRTIITYNQQLINAILNKKDYLLKRKSGYGFLATHQLFKLLDQSKKPVYDGDGDGAFT